MAQRDYSFGRTWGEGDEAFRDIELRYKKEHTGVGQIFKLLVRGVRVGNASHVDGSWSASADNDGRPVDFRGRTASEMATDIANHYGIYLGSNLFVVDITRPITQYMSVGVVAESVDEALEMAREFVDENEDELYDRGNWSTADDSEVESDEYELEHNSVINISGCMLRLRRPVDGGHVVVEDPSEPVPDDEE